MKLRLIGLSAAFLLAAQFSSPAADLRIGMIGLDTSHVAVFTGQFNDPANKNYIPGGKVVAAYKGGSPDMQKESMDRIPGYVKTLQEKYGVKMVDSIDELLKEVDVVMIESIDGRPHLEQAIPVIKAKKPLFIDKPLAGSLRDAIKIFKLAKENNVPVYSGSSLRYYSSVTEMKKQEIGTLRAATAVGPAEIEEHVPDLFWYGVHATEMLYAVMGPGCESLVCSASPDTHIVTGIWKDGKMGTVHGVRHAPYSFHLLMVGEKKILDEKVSGDYTPFLREVMKFFQTGVAPVSPDETIEIIAFMEGADVSRKQGGCPVKIGDLIKRAGGPLNP